MHPQSGHVPLGMWISERLATTGPVSFAQFMEWALYHPELGYYSRGPDIGPEGDFTTSPEVSPAFGRLLAKHVADIDLLLDQPVHFHFVEFGPGRGTLVRDTLNTLRERHASLYKRLRVELVEISPAFTGIQQELLKEHAGVVTWHDSSEFLTGGQFRFPAGLVGAVMANEFIDALPVHILENYDGAIMEHYVGIAVDGGLQIVPGVLSRPGLLEFLDRYAIRLEPGERVEINLAAGEWLAALSRSFERAVITIVDYGDTSPARYSATRKAGTLLAYRGGKVTDQLLAFPGEQDLTALVDFTALQDWAVDAGFSVLGLTRQAAFLLGLGLGGSELSPAADAEPMEIMQYRQGLQALVSMQGLGRFHTLLLGKGVSQASARSQLSGMRYVDVL